MTLSTITRGTTRAGFPRETIDASLIQRQLTTLSTYGLAWAHHEEEDAETAVQSLVTRCWSDTGTYVNPFVDPVVGVEGLTRLILDYRVLFPDAKISSSGHPMLHHDYACWHWTLSSSAPIRIRGTDFSRTLTGHDVIRFDGDQRIIAAVAFFDQRRDDLAPVIGPPAPPHGSDHTPDTLSLE